MRGRNPFDGKPQLTLRDVAEVAGVSEMTVSRVLRNRDDVSGATRKRVFDAARQIGYVPNKIAGALASNRVNLVGVIIPSLANMVFPDVLAGLTKSCMRHRCNLWSAPRNTKASTKKPSSTKCCPGAPPA